MKDFLIRVSVLVVLWPLFLHAQKQAVPADATGQQTDDGSGLKRTRLFLKDGSFQIVLSYRVQGNLVVYRSAERGGEQEEIPLNLVDLVKTKSWAQLHDAAAQAAPVLDPELAREELERVQRTPEVAANLHLPERESLLVLDVFHGGPQLVPLTQTDGDLNRQTAHNLLRQTVNPFSHAHQLVQLQGQRAKVQVHVDKPEFYIRMTDDSAAVDDSGDSFKVDTHGAASVATDKNAARSQYVIVRVDVRQDVRIVSSFEMNLLGSGHMEEDVVETETTLLPGGHWLKLVPKQQLLMGEYALLEVLNDHEINLGVWDFGVHPTAPANRDALLPQERRRPSLGTRE